MKSIQFLQTPLTTANHVMQLSAQLWFAIAFIGQWLLAFYVIGFYGPPALRGDLESWNTVMPHGYIAGDLMGNIVVSVHLLLAAAIIIGGPLQLIPLVRTLAPKFHRWNGSVYLSTAFIISFSGLYMVWIRGAVGDITGHVAISVNALLIMLCAALAWRFAIAREFDRHFRWVLRLFLVVSGVWFFRIGLMLWVFLNGGPVGFDPQTVTGPFINFIVFAQYLLPLTVLELYFYVEKYATVTGRFVMAALMLLLSIMTGIGTFVAAMGMWLPSLI